MRHVWAVVFCLASVAAVGQAKPPQATPQQSKPPKTEQVGRFQLVLYQGEMPRMNTYLLDTVTGKIWIMVAAPDQTTFWEPMYRVDNDLEEAIFVGKHQKKTEPEK
jgi:hypothetical protein